MGKKDSGTAVDVPNRCYEVKADYWSEPSKTLRKEIKDFILMTGQPFMWSGHTHTRPPEGSLPVYLDEFELPTRFTRVGRLSPCPCCWPRHPRFGKGKIAWFPQEGVIRLIGPDCFRALDKDAHDDAVADMKRRKAREAHITYLLSHGDRLRQAYAVCKSAQPIAEAAQALSKALRKTFEERLDLPVWQYVQHGELQVWQETSEMNPEGKTVTRSESVRYATVRGFKILKPEQKPYAFLLSQVTQSFHLAVEHDDWPTFVSNLGDEDRRQIALLINGAVKRGRDLLAELKELQAFTSTLNVSTLRNWGRHPGNSMPLVFERSGKSLRIGKTDHGKMPVSIPDAFEDELGSLDLPLLKEFQSDQQMNVPV